MDINAIPKFIENFSTNKDLNGALINVLNCFEIFSFYWSASNDKVPFQKLTFFSVCFISIINLICGIRNIHTVVPTLFGLFFFEESTFITMFTPIGKDQELFTVRNVGLASWRQIRQKLIKQFNTKALSKEIEEFRNIFKEDIRLFSR